MLRSILFKHKDLTMNLLDSLQGSKDYSIFNTSVDYLASSKTQRNKYAPPRKTFGSLAGDSTYVGEGDITDNSTFFPQTSRDRDVNTTKWSQRRKQSIKVGQISRNANNLTTAPSISKGAPNDFDN